MSLTARSESHQNIASEVVDALYETTRGQPGLVSWLGELLTEKYNRVPDQPIGWDVWETTFLHAGRREPNHTVLNLIKKAKGPYRTHVMRLFGHTNVPFSFDQEGCNYLYTHGILDFEETLDDAGEKTLVCRFSCPFVQLRLYAAFTGDLFSAAPVLALDPLDDLSEVFLDTGIDARALCLRYIAYLERLAASGHHPFAEEPRRRDLGLREAVGHFHLYAWLQEAIGRQCRISPEFPTGNGKVDLRLQYKTHRAIIEVKSFTSMADVALARVQAARYVQRQGLDVATIAMFVPVTDPAVLEALSTDEVQDGVRIITVAIGWDERRGLRASNNGF